MTRPLSVAIVASVWNNNPFSEATRHGLVERGLKADIFKDGDEDILTRDCVLMMGSLASLRQTAACLESRAHSRPFTIAWQVEVLPPPTIGPKSLRLMMSISTSWFGQKWIKPFIRVLGLPLDYLVFTFGEIGVSSREINYRQLRFTVDNLSWLKRGRDRNWLDQVGASTEQKRLFLKKMGFSTFFSPAGLQKSFGRILNIERDIDVLFIGSLKSSRRRKRVESILEQLSGLGYRVHIAPRKTQDEERTHLINRARVVLHIHQFAWDTPWMRWCFATANGAVIASEELSLPDPLRPGIDYLSATQNSLSGSIAELLSNEPKRLEMLENCTKSMKSYMSLERSLDDIKHVIEESTAKSSLN